MKFLLRRHPIAYGLSSSLRRIKHGGVRVLVLSADLKPRYVINQIILLALARNEAINILCVSNLEQEVKSLVDFQCFALSINDTPASAFHKLFDWCRIVTSERYPVPQLIQTYFSARRRPSTEIKSIPMETEPESTESTETPLSSFYLTRSSTAPEQRAFLPKNAINFKPLSFDVASLGQIKSDFISLDAFDSDGNSDKDINSVSSPSSVPSAMQPHEAKGTKHKPIHIKKVMKGAERYQPAKIKRFTGNPGKKKNNGKPKLTREQKKEIRKTMKMAKRNNSNNK